MKKAIFHYTIEELVPYIDWSYLLYAWGIGHGRGKAFCAEEMIADAKEILYNAGKELRTHAIFALYDAKSCGDDIIAGNVRIPLLRQQHAAEGKPNLCLSDFLSPRGGEIGFFATTVDKEFCNSGKEDDYNRLLVQSLADRLAEATATVAHRTVRTDKQYWGYATDEQLTPDELNREEYCGIRPAVGYPSLPDQSIIFIIDQLLGLGDIGIELTGNGAMYPPASVCGMMFQHPESRYFAVGDISNEQFIDYCARRGLPQETMRRFLARNNEGALQELNID